MSSEPIPVPPSEDTTTAAIPLVPAEAGTSKDPPSLASRIEELLKLLGAAYAIGFAVIMLHTARLNGPVVEALQFQNLVAGLPVWVPLLLGFWLWPRLAGSIFGEREFRVELSNLAILLMVLTFIFGTAVIYVEIRWLVGRRLSLSENIVVVCAIVFAGVASMFVEAYRIKHSREARFTAIFKVLTVYSGIVALVVGYAILGYPKLPQSLGGGHPVRVKLYYKDHDLSGLLGAGTAAPGGDASISDPILLYYRTSTYLLVSKAKDQPLIQVPMDQVRSVVWLDSRSQ
jgi:hypothetical protein